MELSIRATAWTFIVVAGECRLQLITVRIVAYSRAGLQYLLWSMPASVAFWISICRSHVALLLDDMMVDLACTRERYSVHGGGNWVISLLFVVAQQFICIDFANAKLKLKFSNDGGNRGKRREWAMQGGTLLERFGTIACRKRRTRTLDLAYLLFFWLFFLHSIFFCLWIENHTDGLRTWHVCDKCQACVGWTSRNDMPPCHRVQCWICMSLVWKQWTQVKREFCKIIRATASYGPVIFSFKIYWITYTKICNACFILRVAFGLVDLCVHGAITEKR